MVALLPDGPRAEGAGMNRTAWQRLGTILGALAACGPAGSAPDAGGGPSVTDASASADGAVPERAMVSAAQGGRVRSADGLFDLVVLPGAIAQDTVLSVRRLEGAAISAAVAASGVVSGVYAVEPDGLQFRGDGAYAIYRFASVPEGLVTGTGAAREYAALTAVAQPAAGGAIAAQPESETLYASDARSVGVISRLAHLSTQFVVRNRNDVLIHLRVDFGEREQRLGDPFIAPSQLTIVPQPGVEVVEGSARTYSVVPSTLSILSRNTGDTETWFGENLAAFEARRTITTWPARGTSPLSVADPPAEFACRVEANTISVFVGMRVTLRARVGRPDEDQYRSGVSIENPYDCVDRPPPPRDAGRDGARDALTDGPMDAATDATVDAGRDATATGLDGASHDVATAPGDTGADGGAPHDAGADAGAPCPTTFTRCGRDCAELSSDVDHCGRCGNVCPTRPYAVPECRDFACAQRCITNYADCDGNAENGCETDLRRPANCGGCGLRPAEVCDGIDNDCDGLVDDGCPTTIEWPIGSARSGPWFGMSVQGDAAGSVGSSHYNQIIGLCGTQNADGSIRQLRGVYGFLRFNTDRTVMPHRFTLRTEEVMPGGVRCEDGNGGGIAGGMPWAIRCPAGMIADGVLGQASTRVGQIQLRCAEWLVAGGGSDGPFRVARGTTVLSAQAGSAPGMPFAWFVPDHPTRGAPGALRLIQTRYSPTTNSFTSALQPHGDSAYFP